jgi:arabinose-5-phosphate isomerase
MTLAMGDALAMVLTERRGFTAEDFGLHHPGGKLGMSLQSVRDWMGDRPPAPATVPLTATFAEVVSAITEGRKGAAAVINADGTLAGIVTDGDVRRAFARGDLSGLTAADVMSPKPKVIDPAARMSDAIDLMTQNKIATLLIVEDDRPVAIVHIAELMQAGYVG